MDNPFIRTEMLLGAAGMERLASAKVAVLGLGGVGSFAAEGLARSGVGHLRLFDQDTVSVSNLNRQLIATIQTVGRPKAEAAARRVLEIHPACDVLGREFRYSTETREEFFAEKYDYIIDAIDLVSCKLDLIETAVSRNVPIISALGTGNKLDPSKLRITDISKSENCPLARVMRKELRARGITKHLALWSTEEKVTPMGNAGEEPPPGRRSIPASVVWVPGVAGLMMAGEVVRRIAAGE